MEFLIIFSLFGILLGVFAVRAAATRSRAPLKEAGVAFLAGVTAGVVWSIGARLAMRIVALIDGREPEFSVGCTLVILIAGVMFGTPLALLFGLTVEAVRTRLSRKAPAESVSGAQGSRVPVVG